MTGLLASLLASALLLDFRNMFYGDWNTHLWLIAYFGESIRHWHIPIVVNTNQLVGIAVPIFYAQKFYALFGMLSAFLGSAVTVRIMIFMVFLLQFLHIYRAAIKAGATDKISICIAVMMTWAIYPLTNLYNRSDLPEFFAVAFLTCSLASFLCVIINDGDKPASRYDMIATGLFFVISAMTHALTALFGGLFLCVLGLTALIFCEKKRKLWLLAYSFITGLLSLLILSPWIYVLARFHDKLPIVRLITRLDGIDPGFTNIFSILSPFPLDFRSIQKGVQGVSTPYLDIQVVLPLMILIAVFIYIRLRDKNIRFCSDACQGAITVAAVGMLIVTLTLSVYPAASVWFGRFFDILQFSYRLSSYINLSILVIVIILAGRMSRANVHSQQVINICLAFCIGISLSALMLKLAHGAVLSTKSTQVDREVWAPLPFGPNRHLIELPGTFVAAPAYTVVDGFAKDTLSGMLPTVSRNFNVFEGDRFGQVGDLTFTLPQPALVFLNVQPFPWNRIVINGALQPQSHIIETGGYFAQEAVALIPGNYTLKVVTQVDGMWKFLNFVSWVLLLGWIALYATTVFFRTGGRHALEK